MTSDPPDGFFDKTGALSAPGRPTPYSGAESSRRAASGVGEVGEFRQGTPGSRWALARYLVGRAIGESVGMTLMFVALVLIALAVVAGATLQLTFVAVLIGLVALFVLVLRVALMAILRRLTTSERYSSIESRLSGLVADTRGDVRRELRRIGLPSQLWTMPMLAFRLTGKRRADTLDRLRSFDVDRAVPAARLDELHLLLRNASADSTARVSDLSGRFGGAQR